MSKDQTKTALRVARLPQETFKAAVEREKIVLRESTTKNPGALLTPGWNRCMSDRQVPTFFDYARPVWKDKGFENLPREPEVMVPGLPATSIGTSHFADRLETESFPGNSHRRHGKQALFQALDDAQTAFGNETAPSCF